MRTKNLCSFVVFASLILVSFLKPSLAQGINPVNPSNPNRPPNGRTVPAGTPVFLRISQADDQAFIKINGEVVLSASWNGGPGSAGRSVLLTPGVYKIEFIVLNNQHSNAGGVFEVLVKGTPLTNQLIGLPWGANSQLGTVYYNSATITIQEQELLW